MKAISKNIICLIVVSACLTAVWGCAPSISVPTEAQAGAAQAGGRVAIPQGQELRHPTLPAVVAQVTPVGRCAHTEIQCLREGLLQSIQPGDEPKVEWI